MEGAAVADRPFSLARALAEGATSGGRPLLLAEVTRESPAESPLDVADRAAAFVLDARRGGGGLDGVAVLTGADHTPDGAADLAAVCRRLHSDPRLARRPERPGVELDPALGPLDGPLAGMDGREEAPRPPVVLGKDIVLHPLQARPRRPPSPLPSPLLSPSLCPNPLPPPPHRRSATPATPAPTASWASSPASRAPAGLSSCRDSRPLSASTLRSRCATAQRRRRRRATASPSCRSTRARASPSPASRGRGRTWRGACWARCPSGARAWWGRPRRGRRGGRGGRGPTGSWCGGRRWRGPRRATSPGSWGSSGTP